MRVARLRCAFLFVAGCLPPLLPGSDAPKYDYRLLATAKTSTMEKELNEAAAAGYSFASVMGGQSAWGGKEVVVVMSRKLGEESSGRKDYKVLATARTSTMQRELQQAADEGFDYCGQTIFQSAFGGKQVSVILERHPESGKKRIEFKLLATSKTSTMEKELREAGAAGFEFLDVVVGSTALGGKEVISLLRRYTE
jgi:hypothetical protein